MDKDDINWQDAKEIEKFRKYLKGEMSIDEMLEYEGWTEEEKLIVRKQYEKEESS